MYFKFVLSFIGVLLLGIGFLPDTRIFFGFDVQLLDLEKYYKLKFPESYSGALLSNRHLSLAERLFENEIHGPESFAVLNGRVFTGLADGRIVEILSDRLRTVASIDPEGLGMEKCGKLYNAGRCGRPLGMRFDSSGILFVLDPYHGLWEVDVDSGKVKIFASKKQLGNAKFLDDFVIIKNPQNPGSKPIFYLTDASTKWGLQDAMLLAVDRDQTGRLLKYDAQNVRLTVELEGLAFPNGITLTDDRESILFASATNRLIYRYDLRDRKLQILVDSLPGEPDNIKRSKNLDRETYWVALFRAQNKHNLSFSEKIAQNPRLLRFVIRLQRFIGFVIEVLGYWSNCDGARELGVDIKTGHSVGKRSVNYGMVLEIDGVTGQIVNSLHSPDGSIVTLSEVMELEPTDFGRHFYLGSVGNAYIGRLDLPKSAFRGSNCSKLEISKEESKLETIPNSQKSSTPKDEL